MENLQGKRVAILIAPNFQDEEGTEPARFWSERGAEITYIGPAKGPVQGKHGREEVEVQKTPDEVSPDDFDLLYVPGGAAPETLRLDERILEFTRRFFDEGKPVAAICHGPQVFISAKVLAGRTVTCYAGIRDDVQMAGALYRDAPVVVDKNLVTSRVPADIPALSQAVAELLAGEAEEPEESEPAG